MFSCELCEISKNTFLYRTPMMMTCFWKYLTSSTKSRFDATTAHAFPTCLCLYEFALLLQRQGRRFTFSASSSYSVKEVKSFFVKLDVFVSLSVSPFYESMFLTIVEKRVCLFLKGLLRKLGSRCSKRECWNSLIGDRQYQKFLRLAIVFFWR